jgi:hypothetical protein
MTVAPSRPRTLVYEAGFLAALLVLSGLAMAEWLYSGSDAPDWQGYKALYEGSADWLTPNSVAPLFIAFLDGARGIFGEQEYGLFRLALFAIFATFAAWLAYIMPIQRRLGGASALMTGGAVLTALLLKSVVQVREGLAFIVVLVGVLALLRRGHFGGARSGAAVLIAPFIHSGIGPLSGVWLVALSLSRAPWKVLERRWLHRALAATSAIIGLALGLLVVGNGETIAVYAASAGIDISAAEQGGFFKLLYWAAVGVAVLILARQSIWRQQASLFLLSYAGNGASALGLCVLRSSSGCRLRSSGRDFYGYQDSLHRTRSGFDHGLPSRACGFADRARHGVHARRRTPPPRLGVRAALRG